MARMARAQSHRSTYDGLLDAAYDAAVAGDWPTVRMADVAAAAGVSRQTLYNSFGTKDALAEALVVREGTRYVRGVADVVAVNGRDPGEAAGAAMSWALSQAAANPLVKAALTDRAGGLLPWLTTRSEPLLTALRDGVVDAMGTRWPYLAASHDLPWVVEVAVRLGVSQLVVPTEPADVTAAHVTTLVRRLLT
jgi:AcrR family transcriptional regulator